LLNTGWRDARSAWFAIGAVPAGAIGVMTSLMVPVVSIVLEAFCPDALTRTGAALAVAGSVVTLWRG
jgi:hypothetical protein